MTVGKRGWKVSQTSSGSLDLKVVPSHSRNHFTFPARRNACMCMRARSNCRTRRLAMLASRLLFLVKWNNSGGLCFASPRLNGHFYLSRHEQWSENPDKQADNTVFQRGDKDTAVLRYSITNAAALRFHRLSGTQWCGDAHIWGVTQRSAHGFN